MTSRELREKYLKYFEKLGHKIISPAPLVLQNDPTTLFTSAGMQPLVPYLKGKPHPEGKRLVNSQPCFRSQDIEEVGDNRHTTFFEMLGNWSLGDYFKEQQISWFWKFLTEELVLPKDRLYVSIFTGEDGVPKDVESHRIWKTLGVQESHIELYPAKKNWWSLSGAPSEMLVGDIGGPDSEVFYDFGTPHDPKFGPECHPNCDCGRFLEIGNSVFIQYEKQTDGSLQELPQKNVDFGGGLERLAAAVNNDPDIFSIDTFDPLIHVIESKTGASYQNPDQQPAMRVIADHIKASTFLILGGGLPANKLHGYVLRRLLRSAAVKARSLNKDTNVVACFCGIAQGVIEVYEGFYGADIERIGDVDQVIVAELDRFSKTLEKGLREIGKIEKIDGKKAFDLYQSYGFPLEITEELFCEKGQEINRKEFYQEFEKHKELSRTASVGMFRGGLATMGEKETRYHTATHLLHAALRQVLGKHVRQMGSNITAERLRFDFSHPKQLSELEIERISDLVNKKVKEDLPVVREVTNKDEALSRGALAFFKEKYPDEVSVYTIGDPDGEYFSMELCGGPHVSSTREIGRVTITKEESAGAGVRRVYAVIGDK